MSPDIQSYNIEYFYFCLQSQQTMSIEAQNFFVNGSGIVGGEGGIKFFSYVHRRKGDML